MCYINRSFTCAINTPKLQSAFDRFARWLVAIYKQAKMLNVNLTDEVRGIFDRIISIDTEVSNTANDANISDLTNSEMDSLGIEGQQRETFSGIVKGAHEEAANDIHNKRNAERKERLKTYRRKALEELRDKQVHKCRRAIKKDPLDKDQLEDAIGEIASGFTKRIVGGVKRNGSDPSIRAAQNGYESVQDMVSDVINAPTLTEEVSARVKEMEAEHDAQIDPVETLVGKQGVSAQMDIIGKKIAN